MGQYDIYRDKLMQYAMKGQTRPFIDRNLQLQMPELERENEAMASYTNIYSHYASTFSSHSCSLNREELEQAVAHAHQSYEAWKRMKQQLMELIKKSSQKSF